MFRNYKDLDDLIRHANTYPTVKFMGEDLQISFAEYSNGRTAIQLVDDEGPFAVATTNLPDVEMEDDEVAIKDYSENEGMLAALQQAGVVGDVVGVVEQGFAKIPVCKLLIKP